MFQIHPVGILALVAFVMCLSLAMVLFRVGSAGNVARMLAFGIRDVCWGFVYGSAIWMIWSGQYAVVDSDASTPIYLVYIFGTLLAVPLIAYGILRTQHATRSVFPRPTPSLWRMRLTGLVSTAGSAS